MSYQKLFCLAFFLLVSALLFGQPPATKNFFPNITPSSPEAPGLGRFGNYPVSFFTGLPDISIPIYEVKVGELSVPISLSYHPAGIKVNDIASWAGLGWSLQAGGTISRKVMGGIDEYPNHYLSATYTSANRVRLTSEINTNTQDGIDYLHYIYLGLYDVQPDIFSYNFPGHSGKFLFNQKNGFNAFLIPYAPVKVNRTQINPQSMLMDIVDESGIKHEFGTYESVSPHTQGSFDPSTWMLTRMVSANLQDTINFTYAQSFNRTIDSYFSDYVVVNDNATGSYNADQGTLYSDLNTTAGIQQILTRIDFDGGKVEFEPGTDARADHNGTFSLQNRLRYIKVYSYDASTNTYNLLRSIELFHSYFINGTDANTKRLRLDSIQVKSSSGTAIQTYRFEYNATMLPEHYSTKKDWWGYFNNRTNTFGTIPAVPTTMPKMQVPYSQGGGQTQIWIGGNNALAREPDPAYMQACVLQKITYPTGGNTQFEYETNQYLDDLGAAKYAGGLRIKKIKSYDAINAAPIVKTYKYGAGETGYGRQNFMTESFYFVKGNSYNYIKHPWETGMGSDMISGTKTTSTYFANPTLDMEAYDGTPVVYPVVTEYVGDETTNTGKTVYTFKDKTDAKATAFAQNFSAIDSYHFIRGLLVNKSDYKNNGDGTYLLVAETRKGYQQFPFERSTGGIGLAINKQLIYEDAQGEITSGAPTGPGVVVDDSHSYQFNNYEVTTSDNKLIADTTIAYDQADPTRYIQTITTYTYDDKDHLGISQVQTKNSKQETLKTTYTYPYTGNANPAMDAKHIWDKVITETKYNNTTQLTKQTNNYVSFAGGNDLPSNIQFQVKANIVETRATFNGYDMRGSVLEMQKTGDIKQAFIWDYKKLNVVAEVSGAAQSEVAYTSFEADGAGGWNGISRQGFAINGSITGKRAYIQTGFSFSKTGLSTTGSYVVSYWSKNGAYNVNAATAISLKSFNGWTLYQHTVTNPSGGTITVSGSGTIDELRLCPSSAFMKTYTYEPLVGVFSTCDINNRIVYYFYDGIGRLLLVKDDNNKILKQFCYNYQGQWSTCNIYGNTAQSVSFTKNDCSSGTSTSITCSVPSNTYYASSQPEANALALALANAEGQAYANATGTCNVTSYAITGTNSQSINYFVDFLVPGTTNTAQPSLTLTVGSSNTSLSTTFPSGTYDIRFRPSGIPQTANFSVTVGGGVPSTSTGITGWTFSSITINSNTSLRAY